MKLNLRNNKIGGKKHKRGMNALKEMLQTNTLLRELDLSANGLSEKDALILGDGLRANGALVKLVFGGDEYMKWCHAEEEYGTIIPPPVVLEVGMVKADLCSMNLCASGALMVSAWMSHIDNMGGRGVTKLVVRDNRLANEGGGKALARMLAVTTTLTELDVSDNTGGTGYPPRVRAPKFAKELSVGLRANRALTSLDISTNDIGELVPPEGWTKRPPSSKEEHNAYGCTVFVHTNGMKQKEPPDGTKPEGVLAIANALSTMESLTVLNVSNNRLGERVLPAGWTWTGSWDDRKYEHTDGREQEAHPGKLEGLVAIANALPAMRALVRLDIHGNRLQANGGKALAGALQNNNIMKELNIASNNLGNNGSNVKTDMSGVLAICDAISTMGALTVLNISRNSLGGFHLDRNGWISDMTGIKALAAAIHECK